ncbi:MAG TPA: hypothetical protein VHV78_02990, partial [Gemmatimonadaceae bacterium]|nr:hypothetical protein [Gemmatimonadaceae bacterium]
MLRILHDTNYDFIKYWRTAAVSTVAFILLGFVLLGVHRLRTGSALNYGIEFTGGAQVQLTFKTAPASDAVRAAVDKAGFSGSEVTTFGDAKNYLVKVQKAGTAAAANAAAAGAQIVAELNKTIPGDSASVTRAESIGARVGSELKGKAITAILISFVVTLIYLAIRFEWRFGVAATLATAHDILT